MKRLSVIIIVLILVLGGISCGKVKPGTTPESPPSNGAPFADNTAPLITNASASEITETTATITWTTDEPATSQVEYGATTNYSLTTPLDDSLVTSHSISLSGLESNTTYHFRIKSEDASGNEGISGDYSFTTVAPTKEVSGVILTDTTWTADYIYIITGKVGVEKGVCLIIEPGTVVKFEPAGMLQIKGTLKAEGLPENRITFTTTPEQGEWKGIVLLEGSTNPIISYTIIEGRALCVYAGKESQVSITHNIIRKSRIGMHIGDWKGTIAYNKIHLNERGVEYAARYGGELSYNTITDNEVGISNSGPISQGGIASNNIFANHQFNLKQWGGTGGEVNASNNWWGTTDEGLIQEGIYDYYDDLTLPKVMYKPYATAPIPEAP